MNVVKERARRKLKRKTRVRGKISGTSARPRLSVVKSLRHIYVQMVDDEKMITLASASTLSKDVTGLIAKKNKTESASVVGEAIARIASEKGIDNIVFDRNGHPYHGRVKALAEAARKAGLKF